MPVITIDMHHIDAPQKASLIRDLTATAMAVTKLPAQTFTIIIREFDNDSIGCAGKTRAELVAAQ
jgi:4-oxalocrotonate tautomerase family enzyme